MITKTNFSRVFSIGIAAAVLVLTGGAFTQISAQKDPFARPGYSIPRKLPRGANGAVKTGPPAPSVVTAPPIEQRIDYYKRMREDAVANNMPLPKVTSVLTLGEMSVTGIFRTPRGFAAMVEAKPISLSYTIYPGEKFFDGQLVAIEENRLVFRKVMKMTNGKFVASVENKALREYSNREAAQGTVPVGPGEKQTETAMNVVPVATEIKPAGPVGPMISPVDEMGNAPAEDETKAPGKNKPVKPAPVVRKPVKVAKAPKVTRE